MKALLAILALLLLWGSGCSTTEDQRAAPRSEPRRWTVHRPLALPEERLPQGPPSQPSLDAPRAAADESPSLHDPPVQSRNTGDCREWPRFDLPLVITLKEPEVPEEITKRTPELTSP